MPGREAAAEAVARSAADWQGIIFLAIPDSSLSETAAELGERLPPAQQDAFAFVHLSGALGLQVLEPVAARGHPIGSFHPLQSFAGEQPATAFKDIVVAIDASEPALRDALEEIALSLGARPWFVPEDVRDLYHAAAVMASNYLVALAAQAVGALEGANWTREAALSGLIPLMQGVLGNLSKVGLPEALTGPIRRGDVLTVRRNLAALERLEQPETARTYRILGLAALELAEEAGLGHEAAAEIRKALTE